MKIIVPFASGGSGDIFARVVGQHLSEAFKQPFVIENRPGAGSIIGSDAAAKSAPDGYTLLLVSSAHATNESLVPNKPFVLMRDLMAVAPINYFDMALVAPPSLPANNVQELIALAKAKPGTLNFASSGPGTPYHMAGELFKAMAKIEIQHVPYKLASAARTDVIGGQVQMMFDAVGTMAGNIQAKQVKALATTGKTRSATLPDVPTLDRERRARLRGDLLARHHGAGRHARRRSSTSSTPRSASWRRGRTSRRTGPSRAWSRA